MRERLMKLVKALADPYDEIVGEWHINGQIINSIQLLEDGFVCYIWDNDFEFQIYDDMLTDKNVESLIEQLENEFFI